MERCFGVLKNRFRVLNSERGMHYSPKKATQIINVCCAVQNICIHFKNNWPELERAENPHQITEHIEDYSEGTRIRDIVANSIY